MEAGSSLPERADAHPRVALPAEFTPGKIGIVTVTYNSAKLLPGFLASLDALSYRNWTLYAVDNASADTTLEMVRAWQGGEAVVLANTQNLGVGKANNQGTVRAIEDGCEYVLHINNDVEFPADLLNQLVRGIVANNADMTTPLTYFWEPHDMVWAAGGYFQPLLAYRNLHIGEGERDQGQFAQARAVTYAPTCCMLFRREVFSTVGLMEERYFLYHDDSDLMLRAWKLGLKLWYLPEAKLWHKVSSIAGIKSPAAVRYGARGRALFIAKFCTLPVALLFSGLYRTYYLLRRLLGKDTAEQHALKQQAWGEGFRLGRQTPGASLTGDRRAR